jgi:hypothetical protein
MIHRHSMDRKFDQRKKRNKISKKHQGGQDPPLTYSPRSWRREREEYRKFVLHQSVIRQFIYFDPGVNPCGGFGGESIVRIGNRTYEGVMALEIGNRKVLPVSPIQI